jgi:N-dimethylarginine dimethylaminohydrolase
MALVQYHNEYGRLRKVALYRPTLIEIGQDDADKWMYISIPDAKRVLHEFEGIIRKFQDLNVQVEVLDSSECPSTPTSNMIYLRDVALVFQDRLLLANMKHGLRQHEPEKFRQLLGGNDKGYLATFLGLNQDVYMEGADILVIRENLLYVYVGSRTSSNVVDAVEQHFPGTTVKTIRANIHGVPQHILGGMHIMDKDLAARRVRYCTDTIEGYRFIDFDEDSEITEGFALNIVTLAPREILMPANRPATKQRLEAQGIICHEVEIQEIHKMGGGLACMVLPLWRDA